MRGLYRRGRVYWMGYSVNGKMVYESTKKTTIRDAEIILSDRKREVRDGTMSDINKAKNYKFIELAQEYLTWVEKQKGYCNKKTYIRQLAEDFGNLNVNDLDTRAVERFQTKHLKTHKPATTNHVIGCLKHLIRKGVDWNMATEETLKQVRKVEFEKADNKRLRFLTIEECQRLLGCCAPHLRPIVTVALHTGTRRGEILGLKWEQVDLRHGFILLDKTKNKERREIPIDNTLRELFEEIPHSVESIYVFTDKNGNPYKTVTCSFSTARHKAGIRDFRFHDLRHTFASHLVMAGVDLTSVKELLGHKTLNMTLRYSHLSQGHKRKAVNTLDNVLNNTESRILHYKNTTISGSDLHTAYRKSFDNKGKRGVLNPRP